VISDEDVMVRLGASVALGMAVGYERERAGRPAGLRTHLLVSVASATFMLVSTQFSFYQGYGKDDLVAVDPSRIAASVVSGVGFLGAGAILRTGLGVQGLTTAASMWLMAAIGLAAGGGMFLVAGAATAVSLFGLVVLRRVEGHQWRLLQRRVEVTVHGNGDGVAAVLACLGRYGVDPADVDQDRHRPSGKARLGAAVRLADRAAMARLLDDLGDVPGVRRVRLTRPG
jgi:putative Mg2+ transporter-C (MgtC) family protein